ncbi:MAG: precorrin-2 C(20)-methyltransferase [Rhizobiaceae bacterium]
MKPGTVHGVGLGPGAPDLMSVRADRLLRSAKQVAYFRKAGRPGQARRIAEGIIPTDAIEIPMDYPVTTEIPLSDPRYAEKLAMFYSEQTTMLRKLSASGEDVVVLCEGDPFFYGSFMHLYTRLKDDVPVEVVPAITGMSGAWTATGQPVTWGDDVMAVLMGTLSEDDLCGRMANSDALVIMKIGRNIGKVVSALKACGRYENAWLVEYATMENQRVQKLAEADTSKVPYFSIVVVHGQGRRP